MSAFHVRKGFALTITLIALNVVVYVYTAVLSGNFAEISYQILKQYGQFNQYVLNGAIGSFSQQCSFTWILSTCWATCFSY